MVETYGSWKVISQSSIPTGIDLNVKIRYNGNSSLSVEFIDMVAGAKRAEKPENTAFVSLVKWI
ncbi:hypothetical protein [Roseburia amylophila]|uniref:hypothetical protein n=1 Tax=Roseburia amylophila TaxID=2981794 RepID=UPI0032BF995D